MTAKVLRANRLSDGVAVWLAADGRWVYALRDALFARHREAVIALEVIYRQAGVSQDVANLQLLDVEEYADELLPLQQCAGLHLSVENIQPKIRLYSVAG